MKYAEKGHAGTRCLGGSHQRDAHVEGGGKRRMRKRRTGKGMGRGRDQKEKQYFSFFLLKALLLGVRFKFKSEVASSSQVGM